MLDEVIALSQFYANQYGMVFHNVYDPSIFTLKGYIIFRNTRKNYTIFCAGLSEKEIAAQFHTVILDILVRSESNDN